ncbi:MAG: MFS transporter [Acidimicrobiia bacterium]|nr:MFS transporter [Acidimicrobiia bacterium]
MASKLGARFDKLSIAAGISNVGDGVMGAAFPLFVASLTRDPVLVAAATFVSRLPWFLFALLSGALVDRLDRKKVMVVTDVLRAIGIGILALGVWTGDAGLIAVYVIGFGLGVAETFFDTSAEALTPNLVDDSQLPQANGRLQALEFVGGSLAGPPIGAFLFALAAALPFVVDSFSFLVAALLIAVIPGGFKTERSSESTILEDIKEGIGWLWRQRVLRSLVVMAGVINLIAFGVLAIFVLYAQDILGVDEVGYGLLISAIGLGGLVGAFVSPRIVRWIGPGNTLRSVLAFSGILSLAFVIVSSPLVAGALMLFFGFVITGWNVVSVSLRQSLTPDGLRARVAGSARLLAWGTQPLGALIGGFLGALSLRAPFLVGAIVWLGMLIVTRGITSNENIEAARRSAPV